MKRKTKLILYILVMFNIQISYPGPWLSPGHADVKNDIDILADTNYITAPILAWPIAWKNIGPTLLSKQSKERIKTAPPEVKLAYYHILSLYKKSLSQTSSSYNISGGYKINPFRTFSWQPRENFDSNISSSYTSKNNHFSAKLSLTYGDYSDLTTPAHFDDSYIYALFDNWAVGFDKANRWWGPGYTDSVIISNNAPPLPTFTVRRLGAYTPTIKWLKWLGPWSFTSSLSILGQNRAQPHTLAWNSNFSFRPTPGLQFDIIRSSLFAGDKRPLNWTMLWNLLTFQNNCGPPHYSRSYCEKYTPGTELWDVTARANLYNKWKIPVNFFLQTIFNDHIHVHYEKWSHMSLPLAQDTAFLAGASTWKGLTNGLLRLFFEFEYTVQYDFWFWGDREAFPIYGSYGRYSHTYYGQIIGSALGSDAIGYTIGGIFNEDSGNSYAIMLRYLKLNTDNKTGITYPFKRQNLVWLSAERSITLPHHLGKLTGELGYLESLKGKGLQSGPSFFLSWSNKL